jgi:hypothetical protein
MVKRSRNRPLGSLWGYFPLSSQGQDMAVDALKNLAKLKLHASELSPLLSGEIFSYFPIHTQLQIAACYFAEGYKIMFRLAMLCLRKCNVTSDAHVLSYYLSRFVLFNDAFRFHYLPFENSVRVLLFIPVSNLCFVITCVEMKSESN